MIFGSEDTTVEADIVSLGLERIVWNLIAIYIYIYLCIYIAIEFFIPFFVILVEFDLVWFYGISTFVGYLCQIHFYTINSSILNNSV